MKDTAKNVAASALMIAATPFLLIGIGFLFATLMIGDRKSNFFDRVIDRIIDGRTPPTRPAHP